MKEPIIVVDTEQFRKPNAPEDVLNFLDDGCMTQATLAGTDFSRPRMLMEPWLHEGVYALFSAPRSMGKTFFCLKCALSLVHGTDFCRWKTHEPVDVAYFDGEMPGWMLQDRIRRLSIGLPETGKSIYLFSGQIMMRSGIEAPLLNRDVWRSGILEYFRRHPNIRVAFFDNKSSLVSGDENSKEEWDVIDNFFITLRNFGIATVLVHHLGKDKSRGPRGTSAIEDHIDIAMEMHHPTGYDDGDGLLATVRFTKTRGIYGDCVRPVTVKMIDAQDGGLSFEEVFPSKRHEILDMLQDGVEQAAIAKAVGCSQSYVSRIAGEV